MPARSYLQLVRRRNAATLLGIIQRQVQPGSILHTDQWAAYRQIQTQLGLNHRTVNHSLHFVDLVTGVHTQHAESNWSTAKEKFKKIKDNTNPNFLIEYLHKFMWRRWYGDIHPNGCFSVFCEILLSRIRLDISVVCNAVRDIPRSTENKMLEI